LPDGIGGTTFSSNNLHPLLEEAMKIPEIGVRMREIAAQIQSTFPDEAVELTELADELKRRSGPRAPATSTPMTEALSEEIREYAEANPDMSHQVIAEVFDVNHGRVSEAIRGKRT
jgi:hypothetical protein